LKIQDLKIQEFLNQSFEKDLLLEQEFNNGMIDRDKRRDEIKTSKRFQLERENEQKEIDEKNKYLSYIHSKDRFNFF
jgi:hypothetical protein